MAKSKKPKPAQPPVVLKPLRLGAEFSRWESDFLESKKWGPDMAFIFPDRKTGKDYRLQFNKIDWPIFKDPKYSDEYGNWRFRTSLCINRDGYLVRGNKKVHALIMKPPKGVEVGHIVPDKLDLRRSNLRLLVHDLNQRESGNAVRSSREMKSPCPHVYPMRNKAGGITGWNVNVSTREPAMDEKGQAIIHKGGPQKGKPKLIGTELEFFSSKDHTLEQVIAIAAKFQHIRYRKVLQEQKRATGKAYVDLDSFRAVPSFGMLDPAMLRSEKSKREWIESQGYVVP